MDSKLIIHHRQRIMAHFAGSHWVINSFGSTANELAKRIVTLHRLAGKQFFTPVPRYGGLLR